MRHIVAIPALALALFACSDMQVPSEPAVGPGASEQLAFDLTQSHVQGTTLAYVACRRDAESWVIDTHNMDVVATLPISSAHAVAITPDGSTAYFANYLGVYTVATSTNTVTDFLPTGFGAPNLAITPNGSTLYETGGRGFGLASIDVASNLVTALIQRSHQTWGTAITPDGAALYLVNRGPSSISIVSTSTNSVVDQTAPFGNEIYDVAIAPTGTQAYVTDRGSTASLPGSVHILSTATNAVVSSVSVGVDPGDVVFTPDGVLAFVGNRLGGTVTVINTADASVVATIAVGAGPRGIAMTPDGAFAYVTNKDSNNVSVIGTASHAVESVIPTCRSPRAIAIATVPPPTPEQLIDILIDDIGQLLLAGVLEDGQANSLIKKLENALMAFENDRPSAPNKIDAFINEVDAMMNGNNPVLTYEQGQPLIDGALAALEAMS